MKTQSREVWSIDDQGRLIIDFTERYDGHMGEAQMERLDAADAVARSAHCGDQQQVELFLTEQIESGNPLRGTHINPRRLGIGNDALDVFSHFACGQIPGRNTSDELVTCINVEDQNACTTKFDVVADAGRGHIE